MIASILFFVVSKRRWVADGDSPDEIETRLFSIKRENFLWCEGDIGLCQSATISLIAHVFNALINLKAKSTFLFGHFRRRRRVTPDTVLSRVWLFSCFYGIFARRQRMHTWKRARNSSVAEANGEGSHIQTVHERVYNPFNLFLSRFRVSLQIDLCDPWLIALDVGRNVTQNYSLFQLVICWLLLLVNRAHKNTKCVIIISIFRISNLLLYVNIWCRWLG